MVSVREVRQISEENFYGHSLPMRRRALVEKIPMGRAVACLFHWLVWKSETEDVLKKLFIVDRIKSLSCIVILAWSQNPSNPSANLSFTSW
jgi:hypothetical protein